MADLAKCCVDLPATLLTTRDASSLMTKTDASLCRVCDPKVANRSGRTLFTCASLGSPKCGGRRRQQVRGYELIQRENKTKRFTK